MKIKTINERMFRCLTRNKHQHVVSILLEQSEKRLEVVRKELNKINTILLNEDWELRTNVKRVTERILGKMENEIQRTEYLHDKVSQLINKEED